MSYMLYGTMVAQSSLHGIVAVLFAAAAPKSFSQAQAAPELCIRCKCAYV
jgi:hypothetical protein